ncbi:MAG: hypothetical protein C0603_00440 [Denitrovibrio sp.]|nr:MAG: hypothetical protein C0603_00440 [Denitrovibrio sp.]
MIVSGSFYQSVANENYKSTESNSVESLATHMNKTAPVATTVTDQVELSAEAMAALREYAPEALSALGVDDDNPILDEVKEIAKEKYFHFGSEYLRLPEMKDQDEIISALDVASRYMDVLNSIEPDDLFAELESANMQSSGDFIERANEYGAQVLLNG